MKFLDKNILIVLLAFVIIGGMISCDDDEPGEPVIHYVRVTDPARADELLAGQYLGDLIAIVGENLGTVREIWFNDRQARFNPVLVTNTTVIVNVPNPLPTEVSNELKMIFASGRELVYPFVAIVPPPVSLSMDNEYAVPGDTTVIHGDFFIEPVSVVFPGNIEGEVRFIDNNTLEVTIPEGATQSGPLTVTTEFGSVESAFWFRDNRNLILNFDDLRGRSWNSPVADASGPTELTPCADNYTYLKSDGVGAWAWVNELQVMYIAEDGENGRGNVPIFPTGASPQSWALRFEINVPIPWREIPLEMFFSTYGSDNGRDNAAIAKWTPWEDGSYTTDGWKTVTIPLTDFNVDKDGEPAVLNSLSGLTNVVIMLFGPAEGISPVHIAIDNVRVTEL